MPDVHTSSEPFFDLLGFTVEEMRQDFCRMRMPFSPALQQAGGLVHGGAIASLIDTVGVFAIKAGGDPGPPGIPTITMTVNYLAPARAIDLTAEARILRRGRSIVFAEVTVFSPHRDIIATGHVVYKISARTRE